MQFVFVGNRKFVLEEMLDLNLNIKKIYVIAHSHLSYQIQDMKLQSEIMIISKKEELLTDLSKIKYDILVSNGCPYIFPSHVLNDGKKYINIHPSFLPDLKGVDPVIGAILYQRHSGASCHHMTETIDGGDIISQIKIPYSQDLDVRLLYQLSFTAEKQAFLQAFHRGFIVNCKQTSRNDLINYKRKEEDRIITFFESAENIINKVNAFNNRSQGAFFIYQKNKFLVFHAKILRNEYLLEISASKKEREVLSVYENCIIVKLKNGVILFDGVVGDLSQIVPGIIMGEIECMPTI